MVTNSTKTLWPVGGAKEAGMTALSASGAAAPTAVSPRWFTVEWALPRRALGLAIGSLLLAGCFSLLLIIGRLPMFAGWVSDPLFFKRCLVLHVDLALIVWFFAFAAGLYALLPGDRFSHGMYRLGFGVAAGGVLAMIAGTLVPGTAPVLANYVPVIDNPVYVTGLVLFFGGLLLCFMNERLFVRPHEVTALAPASVWSPFRVSPEVAVALKTAALAYLVAMTTFVAAWAATPRDLPAAIHYEVVFWGGGHVLQVANVAAMLAVWLLLVSSLLKAPVLPTRLARWLFALLLAPHLVAPLLTVHGTMGSFYRLGFTRLMQFGIAPVVVIVLGICLWRVRQAWRAGVLGRADLGNPRFVGFAVSAALTVTGFVLGAMVRGVNTMIPAHYHASIGAVTAVFMAVTYLLLPSLGLALPAERWRKWIPWQLVLFGGGQVVFAIGFGLGGMHGLSRKAYGADQYVRSAGEWIGLGVMSLGGLVAVAGGLLFLFLMVRAAQPRLAAALARRRFSGRLKLNPN
jgi:hypothetical protein